MTRFLLAAVIALGAACEPTPSAVAPQTTASPAAVKTARPAQCGGFDPAQDKVPDDWLLCSKDDDCVRAHTSCCDCSGGDNGVAIAGRWASCLARECAEPAECIAEEVCQDRPFCSDGMCALGTAPPAAPEPSTDCAGYVAGSVDVPTALLTCSTDADCTLASHECCSCVSGGDQVAVSKASVSCIARTDCSKPHKCAAVYRCDEYVAACRDGACMRFEAPE